MEPHFQHALRLGFSVQQAETIRRIGVSAYIARQLNSSSSVPMPDFIARGPKNLVEMKQLHELATKDRSAPNKLNEDVARWAFEWKEYVLRRCYESDYPLREKINLFFQNHFVSTLQKVRLPYFIYEHYRTIDSYSLSNYKLLVREMVYSNAMIRYLDNQKNKHGSINENLGRELLELFTLGEGNYTENDIKGAAKSLAGLSFGPEKGEYKPRLQDRSVKTFMGRKGNFTIDEVIDIIFEQPATAHLLAEKVLKWFFYDDVPPHLVKHYGDILRRNNFDLKPFFQNLLLTECEKNLSGTQIKNPLVFIIQMHRNLNLEPNYKLMALFLRQQTMDVYDQPNVKGWKGGRDWLTSQTYSERNQWTDLFTVGNKRLHKLLTKQLEKFNASRVILNPKVSVSTGSDVQGVLKELTESMVFQTDKEMMEDLNELLRHDFDTKAENAQYGLIRAYQYLAKSPEFQII